MQLIVRSLALTVVALTCVPACTPGGEGEGDGEGEGEGEGEASTTGTATVDGTYEGVTFGETSAVLTTTNLDGIGPLPTLLIGAAASTCPVAVNDAPLLQVLLNTDAVAVGRLEFAAQEVFGLLDTSGCTGETLLRNGFVDITDVAADRAASGTFEVQLSTFVDGGSHQECASDVECPGGELCVTPDATAPGTCEAVASVTLAGSFAATACEGTFVCTQTN